MMTEKFNYCIARLWDKNSNQICVYTYMSEIHYGSEKEANSLKEFIENKTGIKYDVYKIEKL